MCLFQVVKWLCLRFGDNAVEFLKNIVFLCETFLASIVDLFFERRLLHKVLPRGIVSGVVDCLPIVFFLPLNHYQVFLYFTLEVARDVSLFVIVGEIKLLLQKRRTHVLPIFIY